MRLGQYAETYDKSQRLKGSGRLLALIVVRLSAGISPQQPSRVPASRGKAGAACQQLQCRLQARWQRSAIQVRSVCV